MGEVIEIAVISRRYIMRSFATYLLRPKQVSNKKGDHSYIIEYQITVKLRLSSSKKLLLKIWTTCFSL